MKRYLIIALVALTGCSKSPEPTITIDPTQILADSRPRHPKNVDPAIPIAFDVDGIVQICRNKMDESWMDGAVGVLDAVSSGVSDAADGVMYSKQDLIAIMQKAKGQIVEHRRKLAQK